MTVLYLFAGLLVRRGVLRGARADAPLAVGALLDRTFPYKTARRSLSLESAEDYELLVLRLLSEEADLVTVTPTDAGEMARATLASRVPDLDALRLLRSATLAFTDDALSRLQGVRVLPAHEVAAEPSTGPESGEPDQVTERERVFPIHRGRAAADATRTAVTAAAAGAGAVCWSCAAALPSGRVVSFCVVCGADQREPRCSGCGASVERGWNHCPDCGLAL